MPLALLLFYTADTIITFRVNNDTSNQKHTKSKPTYLKMGFAHRIGYFDTSALTRKDCLDFSAHILRFTIFCTTLCLIRVCIVLHQPLCLYFPFIVFVACMKVGVDSASLAVTRSNDQSKIEHHVLCFTVRNEEAAQAA